MVEGLRMNFDIREERPGCLVVTCNGGLSWNERDHLAANVADQLDQRALSAGIVVDMTGVDYINSAGIGALFQVVQRVRERGGQVQFASLSGMIERVLNTVGMFRVAACHPDVSTALEELAAQTPEPTPAEADQSHGS
jgi:anti-anti-sigma factor